MRSMDDRFRPVFYCLLVAVTAARLSAQNPDRAVRLPTAYEDMQLFSQVLNQLRVNHPDSLNTHTLMMAAIEGMVRAADPHSYVLPAIRLSPEKQEAFNSGELYPVPINFAYVDGAPLVLSISPGSSASTLGISPGDELRTIDGEPVTAESDVELEIVLAGEEGSMVALTFRRRLWDGSEVVLSRTVTRERIGSNTAVVASLMLDSTTGYVRVAHFRSDEVAADFHDAMEQLKQQGMTRMVLDLRDNGGGRVEQAVRIAGEFLPKRAVIYTSAGRKREIFDTVAVERSFVDAGDPMPTLVMVNEGTASAAELLVGALQDHDRAVIIGRPTFGKSLLMRSFPMTDGSLIVLTVGHVLTPCGRVIQRQYRGLRQRDYLRAAGTVPDTTGRPYCLTAGGRKVWGGGGIYPDLVVPAPRNAPQWIADIEELQLPVRWVGSFLNSGQQTMETVEQLTMTTLSDSVVRNFVAFAAEEGLEIPKSAFSGTELREMLELVIAWGRWGARGLYTALALRDPSVMHAVAQFPKYYHYLGRP